MDSISVNDLAGFFFARLRSDPGYPTDRPKPGGHGRSTVEKAIAVAGVYTLLRLASKVSKIIDGL
uniref:Uncharacterized protein n=1 Tax=Oryza meridionalis TaxID=40149 RepID=A0A0E0DVS5_9ORYZ